MRVPIVAALVILSSIVGSSAQLVIPVCGYQAVIQNGKCVCPTGYIGEPEFFCYKPEGCVICRLKCDPELLLFDGQTSTLHLLASNVLSNVKSKFSGLVIGGTCHVVLKSWSARFRGKFYIVAVEFHLKIVYRSGKVLYIWGRVLTWVVKTSTGKFIYKWHIFFYSHTLKKYIPFKLLFIGGSTSCFKKFIGCTIRFHICPDTKFLVIDFQGCGQQFGIRPYNPFKPNVPGVWVKAPSDAIFPVGLLGSLCSRPKGGHDIEELRKKFGFDTRKQLLTYLALTYKYSPLHYPHSPLHLSHLKLALLACSKPYLAEFFRRGEFLFENAALIRCLGPTRLGPLIKTILDFLKAFCIRNAHSKNRCLAAVHLVKNKCPRAAKKQKVQRYLYNICLSF